MKQEINEVFLQILNQCIKHIEILISRSWSCHIVDTFPKKNRLREKNLHKFRKEKKILTQSENIMTFEDTMVFNNMANAIKNLNQSKSICDIIDDWTSLF